MRFLKISLKSMEQFFFLLIKITSTIIKKKRSVDNLFWFTQKISFDR